MERTLEKVVGGDYSLRIKMRKRDALNSFAAKINKIIDLLEHKSHK